MTDKALRALWEKYLDGTATVAEVAVLRDHLDQPVVEDVLRDAFSDRQFEEEGDYNVDNIVDEVLLQLKADTASPAPVRSINFRRWGWIAASIVLLAGIGIYQLNFNKQTAAPEQHVADTKTLIYPSEGAAILTLADGRQITLDSLGNGIVAHQDGADAVLQNGSLSYTTSGAVSGVPAYNTMSTPKGRQFRIILPDGSTVWLNASSSVRFPISFSASERRVEVTGEVYFDVAKDAGRPFIVQGSDYIIKVLGTTFNINDYRDNGTVKVTLATGTISVHPTGAGNKETQLKPGEQWQYSDAGIGPKIVSLADLSQVLAWKTGKFSFNGNIKQIMNEVARWYDIEVKYEGAIPEKELEGGFAREKDLQQVLKILETVGGVTFNLEDRQLTVRAKR